MGNLEASRAAWGDVLALTAPRASRQALLGRARILLRQARWAAAEADLTRRLGQEPRDVRALLWRGLARTQLARREEALVDWRAACRWRDPATWEDELEILPPEAQSRLRALAAR